MRALAAIAIAVLSACGQSPRPTAVPGPLQRTASAGEELTFDGSESRGNITQYTWDFGDGSPVVEEAVAKHTYAENGDYSATLRVRGPGGAHSASVLVNVGSGCAATAMINVVTTDPQPNQPVIFGSTGSTGCMGAALANYEWDFGDGTTDMGSGKATVQHTFTSMGMYTVRLKVTDANGNTGQASRLLGVGVMVTCGKPTLSCPASVTGEVGRPIAMTANGNDTTCSQPLVYNWTFSDSTSLMGSTVMKTFASAGGYTASVTASTQESTPRTSDPCAVNVTVTAPNNYTGSWLISPMGGNFNGTCTRFTVPFPATTLGILHQGNMLTVTPSGGPYPGSPALTGTEEPTMPGTFTVRSNTPNENPGGTCALSIATSHTLRLTFTSPTVITGNWTKVYDASNVCGMASCVPCSCIAGGMTNGAFGGIKQ